MTSHYSLVWEIARKLWKGHFILQTMFIFHFRQGFFLKFLIKNLASFFEKIAKLVKFILGKKKNLEYANIFVNKIFRKK
jgi:hypothetical protein